MYLSVMCIMRESTKRQTRREAGAQSHGPLTTRGSRVTERRIIPPHLRLERKFAVSATGLVDVDGEEYPRLAVHPGLGVFFALPGCI